MKITRIRTTPVNIPLDAPFHWSVGAYPGSSKCIVEVETDAGITGLGEAPWWHFGPIIEHELAPRIIGRDPLDIAAIESLCLPSTQITANTGENAVVIAFGALEMALWDIRGKEWGQPIHKLLGGAVRQDIPFTEYFSFREAAGQAGGEMSAEAIVDYCLRMREAHGSTMFEGKLSLGDPELEIRTVRKLREALGPEAMIRLDSNMQWSLPTARHVLQAIEPYNIRNYEDPVATFEEMQKLRQHSAIPFSSHVPDLRRALALGVPDAFVTNFAVHGGIGRTLRFIAGCEATGVDFWCYSGDTGICTAAYLQVSAATAWIREPAQSLFRWQVGDVIEGGPFRQTGNTVRVPDGPGLGVTLDRQALDRWHRHFVEHGPMQHFHDPFRPGHFRRLPLN